MYLDKLNALWAAHLASKGYRGHISVTNTTKLKDTEGMYLMELAAPEGRYHLYHVLGENNYELRRLNFAYELTSLETVFHGADSVSALTWINEFMLMHYEGIQASVETAHGLEKAKEYIKQVRMRLTE
jgi:hypothetical protein